MGGYRVTGRMRPAIRIGEHKPERDMTSLAESPWNGEPEKVIAL